MYYIKESEPGLWTVGLDTANGWEPVKDYTDHAEAMDQVNLLNGGQRPQDRVPNKRDLFAMAAITTINSQQQDPEQVARRAYAIADQMLKLSRP